MTASGRKHREMVCLVKIEATKRCTPREKGCEHPPSEEECSKEAVQSFMQVSFPGSLFPSSQLSPISFSTFNLPWDPPPSAHASSVKMDLEVKTSVRNKTHYGLVLSPDF